MDNKTGMNPKLADMYEKIMNTPVKSGASVTPSLTSPHSPVPAEVHPLSAQFTQQSVQPSLSHEAELLKSQISAQGGVAANKAFLSTPPPRSTNDKGFTYSVKKNTVEVVAPQTKKPEDRIHRGVPTPVLVITVILFFAGYLVFWLKVLEFF